MKTLNTSIRKLIISEKGLDLARLSLFIKKREG